MNTVVPYVNNGSYSDNNTGTVTISTTTGYCTRCMGYVCNCNYYYAFILPVESGGSVKFNIKVDMDKLKEAVNKEIKRQLKEGDAKIEIN